MFYSLPKGNNRRSRVYLKNGLNSHSLCDTSHSIALKVYCPHQPALPIRLKLVLGIVKCKVRQGVMRCGEGEKGWKCMQMRVLEEGVLEERLNLVSWSWLALWVRPMYHLAA